MLKKLLARLRAIFVPHETYVVKSGDTLSHIAQRYLGNANEYPKIYDLNRDILNDPDKIYPGQKLRIPRK